MSTIGIGFSKTIFSILKNIVFVAALPVLVGVLFSKMSQRSFVEATVLSAILLWVGFGIISQSFSDLMVAIFLLKSALARKQITISGCGIKLDGFFEIAKENISAIEVRYSLGAKGGALPFVCILPKDAKEIKYECSNFFLKIYTIGLPRLTLIKVNFPPYIVIDPRLFRGDEKSMIHLLSGSFSE